MPLVLSEDKRVTREDFVTAVRQNQRIDIASDTLARMDRAFCAAVQCAGTGPLYGVSTGLGPMARLAVDANEGHHLQYNLIRSHAAGMGEPLPADCARGVMLARLISLTRNRSAVRADLATCLTNLINAGIVPYIPRKGGVGASGDLVQLAHLGQVIIGEGCCLLNGAAVPTRELMDEHGLTPFPLQFRDGLAIVNGTAAMTALGLEVCTDARRLLDIALAITCLVVELLGQNRQAYSAALNEARQHPGQRAIAARMRAHFKDAAPVDALSRKNLQAPYSLRCAPQILGPASDVLDFVGQVIVDELNSVSDNPVFDPISGKALHGGNFHGEGVAQALDMAKIAVVKCSLFLERQLNLVLNDTLNGLLPPFLNLGRPGVELGLQGLQFTATSTAAENQTLAYPMSLHSLPSNKDNQDIVSMGTNAAWIARQTVDNAFDIAAIMALAASQAVAALNATERLSSASNRLLGFVRGLTEPMYEDCSQSTVLRQLSAALRNTTYDFQ